MVSTYRTAQYCTSTSSTSTVYLVWFAESWVHSAGPGPGLGHHPGRVVVVRVRQKQLYMCGPRGNWCLGLAQRLCGQPSPQAKLGVRAPVTTQHPRPSCKNPPSQRP